MDKTKEAKANGFSVAVNIDTDNLVLKCRAITRHLTALANDLERIDKQVDSEAKVCMVIDLLNDLSHKDLKEMADYVKALVDCDRGK